MGRLRPKRGGEDLDRSSCTAGVAAHLSSTSMFCCRAGSGQETWGRSGMRRGGEGGAGDVVRATVHGQVLGGAVKGASRVSMRGQRQGSQRVLDCEASRGRGRRCVLPPTQGAGRALGEFSLESLSSSVVVPLSWCGQGGMHCWLPAFRRRLCPKPLATFFAPSLGMGSSLSLTQGVGAGDAQTSALSSTSFSLPPVSPQRQKENPTQEDSPQDARSG